MTTEQPDPTFSRDRSLPPHALAGQRLRRRTSDRVLGGVAGGLADYLNVDPVLIRVAFAGLMIFGGAGFALYVLGWLLIPAADSMDSVGERWLRELAGRIGLIGGAILLVGFLLVGGRVLNRFSSFDVPSEVWLALAITLVGVMLLITRDHAPASGAATGVAAAPARYPDAPVASPLDPTASSWAPPVSHAAPLPTSPRERSPLGWYAVAGALIAIAIAALLDGLPDVRVLPGQYAGAGLLVLGLALVIGAWWGRARLLILLGLLVLPVAAVAAFMTVPLDGGFGDREFMPASAAELRTDYSIAGGRLSIDLTALDLGTGSIDISASAGLGRVSVIVPANATVDVTGTVQGGELDLLGHQQEGTGLSDHVIEAGQGTGPTIHLTLDAGLGQVWVERSFLETN